MVAFSDSHGEEPHDQKMGWHLVRPKYPDLRYLKDVSLTAFSLRLASQYFSTADLTIVLVLIFDGGDRSHSDGWGRSYWRQSCLNLQNHDLGEEEEEE